MNIKNLISPVPQSFELLEGNDLVLGTPGKAFYSIDTTFECTDELTKSAVNLLKCKNNSRHVRCTGRCK